MSRAFIIDLMRWLAALLVVVAWQAADAHPARPHIDDLELDRLDPFDRIRGKQRLKRPPSRPPKPLPPPCPQTTSWTKYARCQLKHAKQYAIVHDLPTAKLIAIELPGNPVGHKRYELHMLHATGWLRTGFYGDGNATTEMLAYRSVAKDTYRIDMGYASPTWVTLDEINSRPAMVRRIYAYFCSVSNGCRTVMVSCDLLVHGKAVSTFRGTPKLVGNTIEIHGDGRGTNRYCVKPPNLIEAAQ